MKKPDPIPMDPSDWALLVHALADGELDAATALTLERRMANDPALAAEHARITALQGALRALPRPSPSETLKAGLAKLGAPKQKTALFSRPRFGSFDWRALAASIVLTAFVASGTTYWMTVARAPQSFAGEVATSHRRSLLATSAVDIASSDRHTVKPWLDSRIGLSPPTVDLSGAGYSLVGGRVEMIGGKPVPALVYRLRKHLITLVAVPQEAGALPSELAEDASAGGFPLVHWSDGTFSYWAVSDIERGELRDFASRFRAAAGAPAATP